jgi:hypothetical protein
MELVNITYAGEGVQNQDLSPLDKQLVNSNFINSQFGAANDYLELYIYDENGNLLDFDYDGSDYYPYITNNPQNNTYSNLTLDPEKDLKNRGFNRGNLNIQYNFYKKLFNSGFGTQYWIKEISTSRTELKLASQVLSTSAIRDGFAQYQSYISSKNYYPVFYLNFGSNQIIIASNVAYTEDDSGGYLLIKLYEPLPDTFDLKTQLWVVDKVAESVSFDVSITVQVEDVQQDNRLRGPNFNIKINNKTGQSTPYYNYSNLLTSPISSSYQKLLSYYEDKSVAINVDYSDFSNFIHFSSAVERVSNFVYKLGLIEDYTSQIYNQSLVAGGSGNVTIVSSSIGIAQSAINNIIEKFDTYEYFLYFQSSSWAWPKSSSTQPYTLYSVTSSQASNFLGAVNTIPTPTTQSLLWSASYYDTTNKDLLHNSVPQYLLDDSNNQPYVTFLDMIGQHFDNIWLYYKDLSNRYNNTNNPQTGISLDVVGDALRGLGTELYTNSNVSDNLYYSLFGINPDGSLLPPTGSEKITAIGGKYVTSSLSTLPADTIQKEIYKRLYHNLPYLLKTKGTERGIKALISTFGIPDDILTVREFGGTSISTVDGIFDLDSSVSKLTIATGSAGIVTGSLTLSSSLLSPYTSIQYYQNTNRINTTDIEVGFSPADTINNNITSSLGYFNIDQLIGNPLDQYSASYSGLETVKKNYFASYTQRSSIWEYIRLIKFYNNSLFKMIRDFVPARTNLSTGIIVKSHMLERNKYARHEPDVLISQYSQSIDTAFISGSSGGSVSGSTSWSGRIMTISGSVPYSSSQGVERFNGQFSGSNIIVTDGTAFSQKEYSNLPGTASYFTTYSLSALYQNVSASVRSKIFWDLDYSGNQLQPVNLNIITQSIINSQTNNYNTYTNPNNPYAYVQDYNYNLKRSIIPRYSGSYISSRLYNTYTQGDISYGKTATIDKGKYQYAYLLDIYGASQFLPNRSNAQIKYLIDNDQNVLDLTKANNNIFQVQNIYKSGETTDISLFEYDEKNPYSQQLVNNPTLQIYEGGFRYLPILHNLSGSAAYQNYILTNPESVTVTVSAGGGSANPNDDVLQSSNWSVNWYVIETEVEPGCPGTSNYLARFYVSYNLGTVPYNVTVSVSTYMTAEGACGGDLRTVNVTVASGNSNNYSVPIFSLSGYSNTCNGTGNSFGYGSLHWPPGISDCTYYVAGISSGAGGGGGTGGSSTATYFTNNMTSSQACLYYISESNQFVFNDVISYFYDRNGITFDSTSDSAWTSSLLPVTVLPFTIGIGDRISVYDSASRLGWNEGSEYVVKNYSITGSGITGSRLLVELDSQVNLALLSSGSTVPTESVTRTPWRACRYIVWKHVPDETNVMLRYNPKDSDLLENGLLFPQYLDSAVKENAGNTVKALRQQNLINPNTNTLIFQ